MPTRCLVKVFTILDDSRIYNCPFFKFACLKLDQNIKFRNFIYQLLFFFFFFAFEAKRITVEFDCSIFETQKTQVTPVIHIYQSIPTMPLYFSFPFLRKKSANNFFFYIFWLSSSGCRVIKILAVISRFNGDLTFEDSQLILIKCPIFSS